MRLPSFNIAFAISIAVLLAFVVWALVDASFSILLEVIRIDLRLDEHPGVDMEPVHGWDQLGPRLVLFSILVLVGALATLLAFYRVLFGNHEGRTIRALFVAIALIGLWLTLILSRDKLERVGYHLRMLRAVSGLKEDAALLLAQWPKTHGALPYSGEYIVNAENPHFLQMLPTPIEYPMSEQVGPFVTREDDGVIRFDFFPNTIEYRPDGSAPTEFIQLIKENDQEVFRMRYLVDSYEELEPYWYLVSYVPDIEFPPDE